MKREIRYTVFKNLDIQQALDADETETLIYLEEKIAAWRELNGKAPLECAVVESDWPEYEPTWEALERRMDGRVADEPTCTWTQDPVDCYYSSACGRDWQFIDGGPVENNVRFCHGCGKRVAVADETGDEG